MENKFVKTSRLQLEASLKDGKTILSDVSFTAPLKVMRPFYEEEGVMTVMQLSASAGIMAGDMQEINLCVREGASMEFISQAYEKIHRMEEGFASRITHIQVCKNARLHYVPLPTIPFAGSDFRNEIVVELEDGSSEFTMCEILTCGRVAREERFQYTSYRNKVIIRKNSRLIYLDNTLYSPDKMEMEGFGMYEGFTHLANVIICNQKKEEEWIRQIREIMDEMPDMEGGITRLTSGDYAIRILGRNAQSLLEMVEKIKKTQISIPNLPLQG